MQGGRLGLERRVSIDVLFHNQWLPIIYTPGGDGVKGYGNIYLFIEFK